MPTTAILDVDGTLVDTNYQHVLGWWRAFKDNGVVVPAWRIHRAMGKGGDQLVEDLTNADVEKRLGEDIRDAETRFYKELIDEVVSMPKARELIVELKRRGHTVVLSSSAKEHELEHYLELLDAHDLVDHWTSGADVDNTKPDPDLVKSALAKANTEEAVMIGDATWDVEAARRAGIDTIALLTGGFPREDLQQAGAIAVYDDIEELLEHLDDTPLR